MSLKDEDIRQLIAILQRGLSEDTDESQEDSTKKRIKNTKNITKQKIHKSSKQSQQSINKFDQMMEKTMHKDDTQIDRLLNVYPPSIRTRDFDPVRVQCRVCQKIEEVNPNLIFDSPSRYKCNKCSGAPG